MKYNGTACGKIILSGEYAVVFGYPGIAIPAPFIVTAIFEPSNHQKSVTNNLRVTHSGIDDACYLHHILEEVQKHTGTLHGHLTITNTIPVGRGMGSSTALVSAICRCLLGHASLPLKHITLSIENTVNPGHSGLDFEVIWNKKPLLFQKGRPSQILDITMNRLMEICVSPVFIDTGKPNETTAEMVRWAKKNSLSPRERTRMRSALHSIARCTERLITGESPFTVFPDHHRAQVALGVVPKPAQDLITDIKKTGGAAKIIGAGGRISGGGMILALHQKPETLHTIAKRHNMPTITLTEQHPPLLSRP